MKLLLVSYFYPPKNNVAATRWSGFVEQLASHGNEIKIITNDWGKESNNTIVVKDGISEDSIQKNSGNFQSIKKLFLNIAPLFLLIDGKLFWSLKVYKKLKALVKVSKPDAIIVTGTPWSVVLIVSFFCKFNKIKLATDFRDFWTYKPGIKFNHMFAQKYFKFLEKAVIKNSNLMITVSEPMKKYLMKIRNLSTLVIPNGYQGDLLSDNISFNRVSDQKYKWLYAGSISQYHAFDIFLEDFGESELLTVLGTDHVGIVSQKPISLMSHARTEDAVLMMKKSNVLVMTLRHDAKHFITGKLMSYIKAERPILYYGPEQSPAADLIRDANIGWVIQIGDVEKLKNTVTLINKHILENKPFEFKPDIEILRRYSIKWLGNKLNEGLQTLK